MFKRYVLPALCVSATLGVSVLCYWTSWYYSLKRIKGYNEQKAIESQETNFWDGSPNIQFRVIDLDGAIPLQTNLMDEIKPIVLEMKDLGPKLRMDCSFRIWNKFVNRLTQLIGSEYDDEIAKKGPIITFYGSNDFHHLSLGLVRRFRQPLNFVIFDNHPDWIQMYPGLHCGSWVNHVVDLPTSKQCFHFGGYSGEFEDSMVKYLQPWGDLYSGKLKVFPSESPFEGLNWNKVQQTVLRAKSTMPLSKERVMTLLEPYAEILAKYPLYISIDKDVMLRCENLQNWNSGVLTRTEMLYIIEALIHLSNRRVLAIDITGDFSKVEVAGFYRTYLHNTQHEDTENDIDMEKATWVNQKTNRSIVGCITKILEMS